MKILNNMDSANLKFNLINRDLSTIWIVQIDPFFERFGSDSDRSSIIEHIELLEIGADTIKTIKAVCMNELDDIYKSKCLG